VGTERIFIYIVSSDLQSEKRKNSFYILVIDLFVFTGGASSPEWVQPTTESEGFLL
jgi:hypothetical protein